MLKSKIKCPYCDEILQEPPKTKKKCPNCNNPVYLKEDPYTNKKYYLTEQGAEKINKIRDRFRIEEKFFGRFQEYGLTDRHFQKRREKYEKKARGNYSAFAFVSSVFNETTLSYAKKSDFQSLKSLYHAMAYFLFEYNRDSFRYLFESRKMELYYLKSLEKQTGFKREVQILTSGKGYACEKCYQLEGKTYTIDEALEKMPIPIKDCENGFCRCLYV